MKSRITKVILLTLVFVLLLGGINAFAYESYDTYTYSIDGLPLMSPTAYSADDSFDSYTIGLMEMTGKELSEASDLIADEDGNLYIADKKNNRIVVLNKYYKTVAVIENYIDEYDKSQTFAAPKGIYISKRNETSDDPY